MLLEVVSKALFAFVVLALPLVFFSEIFRVIVFQIAIILASVLYLLTIKRWSWPPLSVLGLIGLTMIQLVLIPESRQIFGYPLRLQGVFFLWHLLALFIIFRGYSLQSLPKIWILASLATLFGSIFVFPFNQAGRATGLLGEPNALAAVAIFLWPLVFYKQNRIVQLAGLGLCGGIIFFTASWSALVALTLQLLVLILLKLRWRISRVATVCLFLYLLSFSLPFLEQESTWESRQGIWQLAWQAGWKAPLIGYGFGRGLPVIHDEARQQQSPLSYEVVDSSHNLFLDYWLQGGAIGLGLLVLLCIQAVTRAVKNKDSLTFSLLLGLMTVLTFNPLSVVTLAQFWLLLGSGQSSGRR